MLWWMADCPSEHDFSHKFLRACFVIKLVKRFWHFIESIANNNCANASPWLFHKIYARKITGTFFDNFHIYLMRGMQKYERNQTKSYLSSQLNTSTSNSDNWHHVACVSRSALKNSCLIIISCIFLNCLHELSKFEKCQKKCRIFCWDNISRTVSVASDH